MFLGFISFFLRISGMIFMFFLLLFLLRLTGFLNYFLFEQIIIIGFLTGVLLLLLLSRKKDDLKETIVEVLLVVTLFTSLANFSLVNIDRSRSFYLLAWIEQGKVLQSNLQLDLSMVFSKENQNIDAIESRLNEQVSRRLVSVNDNYYSLTDLGKVYLFISSKLANWFDLENWKLNSK
jgi:hypothetical protein